MRLREKLCNVFNKMLLVRVFVDVGNVKSYVCIVVIEIESVDYFWKD